VKQSSYAPFGRSVGAMKLARPALWLTLTLLAGACKKSQAPGDQLDAGKVAEHAAVADAANSEHAEHAANSEHAEHANPEEHGEHGDHADAGGAYAEHAEHGQDASAFTVPFVDQQDPLEQTRNFFKDALGDNAAFQREHDPDFFKAFASVQKPRVTVVTCSDSRVQSTAFDHAPENDLFTIRNIGNQVRLNLGSVEYGVRHLKTPVLLVLGHTGCGAVKAAMGDASHESAAIRHELDGLALPKRKDGASGDDPGPWLEGVTENVHDQVAFALTTFAEEVRTGRLTVVGAVYDFRNDMKRGAGKLAIIDVNGITAPAKMQAFERLVLGLPLLPAAPPSAKRPAPAAASAARSAELKSLIELRDELRKATTAAGASSAQVNAP
jgi:carbonic anhydrase